MIGPGHRAAAQRDLGAAHRGDQAARPRGREVGVVDDRAVEQLHLRPIARFDVAAAAVDGGLQLQRSAVGAQRAGVGHAAGGIDEQARALRRDHRALVDEAETGRTGADVARALQRLPAAQGQRAARSIDAVGLRVGQVDDAAARDGAGAGDDDVGGVADRLQVHGAVVDQSPVQVDGGVVDEDEGPAVRHPRQRVRGAPGGGDDTTAGTGETAPGDGRVGQLHRAAVDRIQAPGWSPA